MDSISGFLIHFVVLKDFITTKPPPKSYVYKKFDNLDSNKLKADLHKIDWINEILKWLVVMRHLTKSPKKKRILQSKPCINKEIKHQIFGKKINCS